MSLISCPCIFLCCSVNVSVCLVCCVLDSVCEFFHETIRDVFRCGYCFVVFTAGSVSLCCVCGRLWSVCEFVVVPYVDEVVDVTVMCVLLFVLHVCLHRECDGNAGVGDG